MKHNFNKLLKPLILFSTFSLAIVFVVYIHIEEYGSFNLITNTNKKILYNIPIINNLEDNKYSISQVPTSADVEVEGNTIEIAEITKKTLFQLYIPNHKLSQGDNTIEIKVRNESNSLKVNVLNKFINIKADKIETKVIPIFPQYINQQELKEKEISKVILSKDKITIKSSKTKLDKVKFGSVIIDLKNILKNDNSIEPTLQFLDANGRKVKDVKTEEKVHSKVIIGEKENAHHKSK